MLNTALPISLNFAQQKTWTRTMCGIQALFVVLWFQSLIQYLAAKWASGSALATAMP